MKIQLDRAGGFAAAMRKSVMVDSADLPADEEAQLRTLVASADVAGAAASPPPPPARHRADALHYRLTVEDGGRTHTIEAGDPDIPESIRPLIAWLLKR